MHGYCLLDSNFFISVTLEKNFVLQKTLIFEFESEVFVKFTEFYFIWIKTPLKIYFWLSQRFCELLGTREPPPPPSGPKILHFYAVFGKNWPIGMVCIGWSPALGLASLGNPGSATGSIFFFSRMGVESRLNTADATELDKLIRDNPDWIRDYPDLYRILNPVR